MCDCEYCEEKKRQKECHCKKCECKYYDKYECKKEKEKEKERNKCECKKYEHKYYDCKKEKEKNRCECKREKKYCCEEENTTIPEYENIMSKCKENEKIIIISIN
jgi:hypothetical protein